MISPSPIHNNITHYQQIYNIVLGSIVAMLRLQLLIPGEDDILKYVLSYSPLKIVLRKDTLLLINF